MKSVTARQKQQGPSALEKPRQIRDSGYSVVAPILDADQNEWSVQIALDLAYPRKGKVILVGIVPIPPGESLSTGLDRATAMRAKLGSLRVRFEDAPVVVKPRVRVVHDPWASLAKVVESDRVNVAMLPWPQEKGASFFAMELDQLASFLKCHVIVATAHGIPRSSRLLMPIRGSKEAPLTLEVALSLAKATQGQITMLYATRDDKNVTSQRVYRELARMSQGNPWIRQELRVQEDVVTAILAEAGRHDLVVLGAAEHPPESGRPAMGYIAHRLQQRGVGPALVVKSYQPLPVDQLSSWNQAQPLPATPTSVMVDKWFAENTFNSQEFEDLAYLVRLKEEQKLTISLGLPTLNEEETIGKIIETMQGTLVEQFPLLDEIVLIDSGSTDYTVEIARDLGVPVYQHANILSSHGAFRGKGEALWKSLYVLKGDLIAWIDTDIVNIDPRFVYGILGPLLVREGVQYVKGFYRRPLKVGDTLQAGGGGRVTELVARPLFNLFYPELSGVLQPLSGEYAGRRTALEKTPFYSGYGVETGLLLSLVERYGISGIAQVDLRQRIHHNQSLEALSRMAFAIIQVFVDHLERRQRVELLSEINRTMKIIRYHMETYTLEEHAIRDRQRPPIADLPEYRQRYGKEEFPSPPARIGYYVPGLAPPGTLPEARISPESIENGL